MAATPPDLPSSDVELFSDDLLIDPYAAYADLRGLGPVVRLERYGCWAVTGCATAPPSSKRLPQVGGGCAWSRRSGTSQRVHGLESARIDVG
jgi:hypothetical protein